MNRPAAGTSSADPEIDRSAPRTPFRASAAFISAGILAAVALVLFITAPTAGDFWWFDSSRHAMNGVFLRDFLLDGGLRHPLQFAENYYRKYPAINIGFYPPFLYLSSVPFLIAFGVSHAVAQSVVSLYALGAGLCVYLICSRATDSWTGVAAAVLAMTVPDMALWSRQVQLDVPAIALVLATCLLLIRHLRTGRVATLFGAAVCLGLALLTRQQAGFAVPVFLGFLFLHRYPNRPPFATRLGAVAVLGALALPSMLMFLHFSRVNANLATAMPGMPRLLSIENWTWYLGKLPAQLGVPATILALGGFAAAVWSMRNRSARKTRMPLEMIVVGCFALASWVAFSVISNKEQRFDLPIVPFVLMFAAIGLYRFDPRSARIAIGAVALFCAIQSIAFDRAPVVAGFEAAAKSAAKNAPPDSNVLISAHRDGSFIFDLRALGTRPDIEVRRGDKLFVEIRIMRQLGIRDLQLDQQAILDVLDREKISTIVMQRGYLIDQPTMRTFQDLLESQAYFIPIDDIAMSGDLLPDEKELVVYRRK